MVRNINRGIIYGGAGSPEGILSGLAIKVSNKRYKVLHRHDMLMYIDVRGQAYFLEFSHDHINY